MMWCYIKYVQITKYLHFSEHLGNGGAARGVVENQSGLRLETNALWDLPNAEIGQDTPSDELHVIMMGIVQHLFDAIVFKISNFLRGFKKLNGSGTVVHVFTKAYVQRYEIFLTLLLHIFDIIVTYF